MLPGAVSYTHLDVYKRQRIPSLVASGIDTLRADLANQISEQVKINTEALRGDLQNVISEQIKGNLAEVQTQLDAHISDSVNARLAGLDEIVAKSVATATRDLPQKIGAEVKTQIDALKLGDQIKSANADLAAQLRKEQALALSDQQATTSAAINSLSLIHI